MTTQEFNILPHHRQLQIANLYGNDIAQRWEGKEQRISLRYLAGEDDNMGFFVEVCAENGSARVTNVIGFDNLGVLQA